MRWQKDKETKPPLAWITQTRRGHGYSREPDPTVGFIVDFEGPVFKRSFRRTPRWRAWSPIDGNGEIVENHAYRNDVTGGYRLRLRVKQVDDKKPVELRAFLRSGDSTMTPTWSYILPRE